MICLKRLDRGWRRWTRSRGGPRDTLRWFGEAGAQEKTIPSGGLRWRRGPMTLCR